MTKRVLNSRMVAHVWAARTQDSGRNSRGNFFFEGDAIYSYGAHFMIARHVKNKSGSHAILFTTRSYSNTTAKQIGRTRQAISNNTTVFHLSRPEEKKPGEALAEYKERIANATLEAARARSSKEWKENRLQELVNEANAYAEFFGLKTRFTAPTKEKVLEDKKKQNVLEAQKEKRRQKKLEEARAEAERKEQQHLKEWFAGTYNGHFSYLKEVYLRVRKRDDEEILETTKGAEVPLRHALKLLPLIRAGIERKFDEDKPLRVGHFHVDEISAEGDLRAGCHTIKRSEIERLALLLGHGPKENAHAEEEKEGQGGAYRGGAQEVHADEG